MSTLLCLMAEQSETEAYKHKKAKQTSQKHKIRSQNLKCSWIPFIDRDIPVNITTRLVSGRKLLPKQHHRMNVMQKIGCPVN